MSAPVVPARRACILDARLALGPYGFFVVSRLARSMELWLPTRLRELLHDLPRDARSLLPPADGHPEAQRLQDELAVWDRFPEDPDLASLPLLHVGNRADESSIPPHIDRGLRGRFDQMRHGLEVLRAGAPRWGNALLEECYCDTVALAVALSPYQPFVLTRVESGSLHAPALCHCLDAWGILSDTAPRVNDAFFRRELPNLLSPLPWSGLPLAAAHVIAPGMPLLGGALPGVDPEAIAQRWRHARVYWHPLGDAP